MQFHTHGLAPKTYSHYSCLPLVRYVDQKAFSTSKAKRYGRTVSCYVKYEAKSERALHKPVVEYPATVDISSNNYVFLIMLKNLWI